MQRTVCRVPKRAHVQRGNNANSNVFKILPLTTFRTIDLGGGKISDPLFSIFCAEARVFFDVFSAPKYVQVTSSSVMIERLAGAQLPVFHDSFASLVAGGCESV